MKTDTLKNWAFFAAWLLISIIIQGCSDDDGNSNLPIGQYKAPEYSLVELGGNGTYTIVHVANAEDPKDYTISGTFTHTLDVNDPEGDTYGKIDLVAQELTVNGSSATQITGVFCDFAQDCFDPVLKTNDTMTGWWAYSSNITWGGSMRIWLNYAPTLRGANPYSGHRSLISVDPI